MGKTITLTDDQIPFWEEFIQSRESALEKQLEAIRQLKNGNPELTKPPMRPHGLNAIPVDMGKYDSKWPAIKKIEFILNYSGKAMTSTDIVNKILAEYEPEKATNRRQVMSGMSSVLTLNNGVNKPFYKITDENTHENLYGLNKWK